VCQNGSTARDIASQQGYRAVAELLAEYERRLELSGTAAIGSGGEACTAATTAAVPSSSHGVAGARAVVDRRRPPAVYNRDVIPSPRNSPLKTCTPPLDQYFSSGSGGRTSGKHSSHPPH